MLEFLGLKVQNFQGIFLYKYEHLGRFSNNSNCKTSQPAGDVVFTFYSDKLIKLR